MRVIKVRTCRSTKAGGEAVSPRDSAFTLCELLVVLAVLGLLAMSFVPAMAKTKSDTHGFRCLNNHRRLLAVWRMYSEDNSDKVANNFGVPGTSSEISMGTFRNWCNNVLDWGSSSMNTNLVLLEKGIMAPYLGGDMKIYRCPADNFLSSVQRALGWESRTRSFSMNLVFGRYTASDQSDPTLNGRNYFFSQYRQYLKQSETPKPNKTWVFIEEHPDSINDGYYLNNPSVANWQDIPASFHNGGCTLSFADGRAEIHRWRSTTSWYPSQFSYPTTRPFDALGQLDFAWYLERTGYTLFSNGDPQFGY